MVLLTTLLLVLLLHGAADHPTLGIAATWCCCWCALPAVTGAAGACSGDQANCTHAAGAAAAGCACRLPPVVPRHALAAVVVAVAFPVLDARQPAVAAVVLAVVVVAMLGSAGASPGLRVLDDEQATPGAGAHRDEGRSLDLWSPSDLDASLPGPREGEPLLVVGGRSKCMAQVVVVGSGVGAAVVGW